MPKRSGEPSSLIMTGPRKFITTCWERFAVSRSQSDKDTALRADSGRVAAVYHQYGKAVHSYIEVNRSRYGIPRFLTTSDLTQEFFEVQLRRNALANLDPAKGSFRAWLKQCLRNFLRDVHDLKPGNVLRVPGRELVVADFGLALDLDEPPSIGASEHGCGTPGYFAPEVARGEPATCTSDVYSIGVILYELMTNRLPVPVSFEARYYAERVQTWEVVPPRKLLKGVSRGLDAVCMKALARQPEHRYQTADLLAEDLDRVRAGHRPKYARVPTMLQGTTRFARRYPVLAAVLASLLLLVCSAGSLAFALYQFDIDVERYALGQLSGQAKQYAAAVVTQLEIYGGWARAAAADEQTLAILENATTNPGGNLYLKPYWLSGHFSTITVLTPDGRPLTQYPEPSRRGYYEQSYGWRDYVTRARRLATYDTPGASLVAAFRSRADGKFKSAFVVAVFDAAHVYRGFLLATRAASGSFGNVIARNHAEGRIVTLLAPTESSASSVPERSLSIVVHPGIRTDLDEYRPSKREQARLLSVASCRKERQEEQLVIGSTGRVLAVADYVDAVPGYRGFRLAAAAAVGCTGYVLMIQERSESLPFWRALDRSGAGRAGLVHALALILMLGVMILTIRFYLRR